ncbi:hypothetical protein MJO29_005795 [Puccinia striiformis f. sp. tritici]|nr:hypothetical protein MJO29_005795 [Puccinia striiformis f. sp. tritici]
MPSLNNTVVTTSDESSSDDSCPQKVVSILKLNGDNWMEWKKPFKDLLIGEGHEEVFDAEWFKTHMKEKKS